LEVRLLVGSTDKLKLWLNGELVHQNSQDRFVAPDQDRVPVILRQGWNILLTQLTKLHSYAGGLYVRFSPDPVGRSAEAAGSRNGAAKSTEDAGRVEDGVDVERQREKNSQPAAESKVKPEDEESADDASNNKTPRS
jgi:hypothetical protein